MYDSPQPLSPLHQRFCGRRSVMALVRVRPFASQIDEIMRISVAGLLRKQRVTLKTNLTGDSGERFESFAYYIADEQGRVCVSSQPSVGGSYTGVEPMGLMWSMKLSPGQDEAIRLLKKDVTKPYIVNLDVFDGHLRLGGEQESVGEPLTSATFEKSYMKAGVRRIPVREGRLRGTLFLPPGDGPFPGILEFSGAIKGLMEIKGPLLASHGFATLSLAFYGYDDLPKSTKNLDCSYFEEAAEWLSSQAQVSQGGIGVMTVSSGSQFLFMLAIHRKDLIKAIVVISPLHCFAIMGCHYKGEKFPFIEVDHKRHWRTEKGYIVIKDTVVFDSPMNRDDSRAILPVEHIECPILLIYGEADLTVPVEYMTKRIVDRLKAHGKGEQCTVLRYPGAGHMIDPPYHPLCEGARFEYTGGEICAWGGETRGHAMAQEDSWAKIQSFFRRHLQITSCL